MSGHTLQEPELHRPGHRQPRQQDAPGPSRTCTTPTPGPGAVPEVRPLCTPDRPEATHVENAWRGATGSGQGSRIGCKAGPVTEGCGRQLPDGQGHTKAQPKGLLRSMEPPSW